MTAPADKNAESWEKTLFVITATVVAVGVAFFLESPYMAFAVYAFLLLVISASLSSFAWMSGLECERDISATQISQGEDVRVTVRITNRRGWPIPWIFVEDFFPVDFPCVGPSKRLAVLMPRRSVTLEYKLTCPRRGYHRIGPVLYESGDLFGLHKRFRSGETRDYISVLPTIAYIETFNVSARRPQGPVRLTNRIYTDPTRINNIREYVPGDPLNTIHWKVTARTGELHVKTFEPSTVTGGTLILDMHDDNYVPENKDRRMELAVTTTASIAYLLQMSGEQVGLLTNGRDAAEAARYEAESVHTKNRFEMDDALQFEGESTRISPLTVSTLRSPGQAQKIIENLARVLPGHGLDLPELIMSQFRGLPRDATLLPVAPQVTEKLALALASMKVSGFNVTVFLIDAGQHYHEAAALLAEHNIHVFHIETERHLHEISPTKI
ncbi:MAG TPA: DUF58 domain-containing protein [Candidatus Hydrogenedentes bacterium]|nr:DUF58 domain-containing protein [Candidatus Hydrogenedentota bacterium]